MAAKKERKRDKVVCDILSNFKFFSPLWLYNQVQKRSVVLKALIQTRLNVMEEV